MDPRTRQKERSYLLRSEAARIRIQTKRRYASAGSIVEGSGLPPDTATHRYNAGPRGSTYQGGQGGPDSARWLISSATEEGLLCRRAGIARRQTGNIPADHRAVLLVIETGTPLRFHSANALSTTTGG